MAVAKKTLMKNKKMKNKLAPNPRMVMSAKEAEFFMSGKKKKYKQGK
jgi:hypothetical protein